MRLGGVGASDRPTQVKVCNNDQTIKNVQGEGVKCIFAYMVDRHI